MIYFNSILVGLFAAAMTVILYIVGIFVYIRFYVLPKMPPPPHAEVGFDLSSMGIALWPALVLSILAFVAAFYAMFRRSTIRR